MVHMFIFFLCDLYYYVDQSGEHTNFFDLYLIYV